MRKQLKDRDQLKSLYWQADQLKERDLLKSLSLTETGPIIQMDIMGTGPGAQARGRNFFWSVFTLSANNALVGKRYLQ